ncbi:MAG: anthranilate phosphoribosyltransferase [Candidatus Omnitrophica bacterium]|nr:anthranilate phosphoribosyltransferase [Candidatus Omnitrophota bacterium]
MIKDAIIQVTGRKSLTEAEANTVFNEIMSGLCTPAQIGALLVALKMKGETAGEITGAARAIRERALRIYPLGKDWEIGGGILLDTCGTGGSGKNIFNVSTVTAFVVAGAGVKVSKHGNRASSGSSGSADVLEALGVKVDVDPLITEKCVREIGIGFMFAPVYHAAMKHAALPRKEIGVRTIFNLLGPLANPANANCHIMGVFDGELAEIMADVLERLGVKHAYVVHGMEGLDEVSITGKTMIFEVINLEVKKFFLEPSDFGIGNATLNDIKGGTPAENAKIARDILSAKKGPCMDMVLLNASIALMASGKAANPVEGVKIARYSIESGAASAKLDMLVKITREGEI